MRIQVCENDLMKHNEIILRNQAHPRLTANTTTSSNLGTVLYVTTGPGYIEFPKLCTAIYKQIAVILFNKELRVNQGIGSTMKI